MIRILCVGRIKEKYLIDLICDYGRRISKYHKIIIDEIKDTNLKEESLEILKRINDKDYNVLLDSSGKKITSKMLASKIETTFISFSNITFIVGGSDGVSDDVRQEVREIFSFGDVTFPHGLFRGILLEQIYRSFKIMNNEKYHK